MARPALELGLGLRLGQTAVPLGAGEALLVPVDICVSVSEVMKKTCDGALSIVGILTINVSELPALHALHARQLARRKSKVPRHKHWETTKI